VYRRFLGAGCALLLVGGALGWAWFGDRDADQAVRMALGLAKKPQPAAGDAVLDSTLHDLEGHVVHLRDFVGREPVVVEFGGFT
jgi:hypothetical protein